MLRAKYYEKKNNYIVCTLCPHQCRVYEGGYGRCGVRKNIKNKLFAMNYGVISSMNFDPIEKKPFYHFYPGNEIMSIGTVGCNMNCEFCQNWEISQTSVEESVFLKKFTVEEIIEIAEKEINNIGIAFTYNEPTVWFEFINEVAVKSKAKGLVTAMVTNAFISKRPLEELSDNVDAFSIDLKAFNNKFYNDFTGADIAPVKDNIKFLKEKSKHIEIDFLVIPGENDNMEEFVQMIDWIGKEIGYETPFHINRYFPRYKSTIPATPESTLLKLYDIAQAKLDFVYIGNIKSGVGSNTFCPECKNMAIERVGYYTKTIGINSEGKCMMCGSEIAVMEE